MFLCHNKSTATLLRFVFSAKRTGRLKERLLAGPTWRAIRLWDSPTPSANYCWAFGNTYQSSESSRADDATWATPQPHCWPVGLPKLNWDRPHLRRCGEQAATAAAKHGQAGERWRGSGAPAHRICSGFFAAQPSPQRRRRRRASDRCVRFPLFRARDAACDPLHSFRDRH